MKEITVQMSDIKKEWSKYLRDVSNGISIIVVKGKQQEPIAQLIPIKRRKKRNFKKGTLNVKAKFSDDWQMSEEELLGL